MKNIRRTILLLCIAMLLGLLGCGKTEPSETAPSQASPASSVFLNTLGDYVIPSSWHENAYNDGSRGYITSQAQVPSGTPSGSVLNSMASGEDSSTLLNQYDLQGNLLHSLTVPPLEHLAPEEQFITDYHFGSQSLWLVRNYFHVLDEETGDTETQNYLERWSYEGEMLSSITLDTYGIGDTNDYMGMDLGSSGPILLSAQAMIFLDESGTELGRYDTQGRYFQLCRDASDRLYVVDNMESNALYTLDEANFALGEKVMDLDGASRILTGGGDYDLFFSSDNTLKGVSFQTGTVTEILSWGDWDLAGSVSDLAVQENGDFLLRVNNMAVNTPVMLTMTEVSASEIPEKTILRVAVPLRQEYMDMDLNWTESMDQKITGMLSLFNQQNPDYRLEVVTFSSATELNLMLVSGEAPDLIYWNYTAWLDEPVSTALLAKKGYLENLEPYFKEDTELSLDLLAPNVVELERQRNGGIYAPPLSYYVSFLIGRREYVGDGPTISIHDMLEVAENLPEDMSLWEYPIPREELLGSFLEACFSRFVNLNAATCDFQNQDFYDLLALSKVGGLAVVDENSQSAGENSVVTGFSSLGRLGTFYTDTLAPLEAQGKVLLGYPGTDSNGLDVIFMDQFAICSLSQHKDAAWQFIRSLYQFDFQKSYSSIFIAARQDVMEEREREYQQMYSDQLTEEQSRYVQDLVLGATHLRVMDSPVVAMVKEEAAAFFAGDKTAQEVAEIIENRVQIYLSEQS